MIVESVKEEEEEEEETEVKTEEFHEIEAEVEEEGVAIKVRNSTTIAWTLLLSLMAIPHDHYPLHR